MFDRRINLIEEGKRHIARQIDRSRRLVEHKARLRDVHVELVDDLFGPGRIGLLDGRLGVGWKQRQKLLLDRALLPPIRKADQIPAAGPVAESDRLRLDLLRAQISRRCHILDAEFLRARSGDDAGESDLNNRMPNPHVDYLSSPGSVNARPKYTPDRAAASGVRPRNYPNFRRIHASQAAAAVRDSAEAAVVDSPGYPTE